MFMLFIRSMVAATILQPPIPMPNVDLSHRHCDHCGVVGVLFRSWMPFFDCHFMRRPAVNVELCFLTIGTFHDGLTKEMVTS